jgi:hypothetical protein
MNFRPSFCLLNSSANLFSQSLIAALNFNKTADDSSVSALIHLPSPVQNDAVVSSASSYVGTYIRRNASAGSIRTARHAGSRAPRTQSAKAAPTIGAISPTLGLNEIRLPIVGMRGNP